MIEQMALPMPSMAHAQATKKELIAIIVSQNAEIEQLRTALQEISQIISNPEHYRLIARAALAGTR